MKQITPHFTLEEFTKSDTALRVGIKNEPSPNILANIALTADGLEKVRAILGKPIFITSGYRSPTLNRFIGGSVNSAHCLGYAVDFKCPQFGNPDLIVRTLKDSGLKYDQLICEGGLIGWVHISFDPRMRQQTLNALFDNKGKATYREFV
jgi:putative chitinase